MSRLPPWPSLAIPLLRVCGFCWSGGPGSVVAMSGPSPGDPAASRVLLETNQTSAGGRLSPLPVPGPWRLQLDSPQLALRPPPAHSSCPLRPPACPVPSFVVRVHLLIRRHLGHPRASQASQVRARCGSGQEGNAPPAPARPFPAPSGGGCCPEAWASHFPAF